MKKLFVLFICLFTLSTATYAREDRPIRVDQLPAKAQKFIKKFRLIMLTTGCRLSLTYRHKK